MNKLVIEATEDTPKVVFNVDEDVFEISGRSYPDNVLLFYNQIFVWLNEYATKPKEKTVLEIKLDYFNTASAKILYDILSIFDKMNSAGHQVKVLWYCNDGDDDMVEAGEGFKRIIKLPIDIISI